jgi:hypothetical protein
VRFKACIYTGDETRKLGIHGRIILKLLLREKGENADWTETAVGGGRWPALVNTLMNLRVPLRLRIS